MVGQSVSGVTWRAIERDSFKGNTMITFIKGLFSHLKTLGTIIFLAVGIKLLSVFAFLSPAYGNWLKRMLTLSYVMHELNRRSIFKKMTLDCVNQNVLHLKKTATLESISAIASLIPPIQTALPDVKYCNSAFSHQSIMDPVSVEKISKFLIMELPPGLRYGESLMVADIEHLVQRSNY